MLRNGPSRASRRGSEAGLRTGLVSVLPFFDLVAT